MRVLNLILMVGKYRLRIITEVKGSRHVEVKTLSMSNYKSAMKIGQNIAKRGVTVDVVTESGTFVEHIETKISA